MDVLRLFRDLGLMPSDKITFAKAFQICLTLYGRDKCWPMDRNKHLAFGGFGTRHPRTLQYKGLDARPLIMGMTGQFQEDESQVVVRKSFCKSQYCLNPSHYYWGDRVQVALEGHAKKRSVLSGELVQALRVGRQGGERVAELARKYKVPYHTVRRICAGETYENLNETRNDVPVDLLWTTVEAICNQLTNRYPKEAKEYNLAAHVSNELECPWHRNGMPGHKGNFGLMGECLDCMEEVKKGRCLVDVTKFDFRWYWTIKRFWDYVDMGQEDECWPWIGPTKKGRAESVAYFPSPHHSGKTQSASRVAFWLSRGYVGKYRVFSKSSCSPFCCNPKHLTIRELKDQPQPDKIETINLSYGNIFEHHRENYAKNKSGLTD